MVPKEAAALGMVSAAPESAPQSGSAATTTTDANQRRRQQQQQQPAVNGNNQGGGSAASGIFGSAHSMMPGGSAQKPFHLQRAQNRSPAREDADPLSQFGSPLKRLRGAASSHAASGSSLGNFSLEPGARATGGAVATLNAPLLPAQHSGEGHGRPVRLPKTPRPN
jgi:hypothetical protein